MIWPTVAVLISAVVSLISLALSVLANIQQKRSYTTEIYRLLIDKWLSDKDIYKFINMVEYNDFNYGRYFHNANSEIERIADKTLMFFNQVCFLERNGSVPADHMGPFEYQIVSLVTNEYVRDYLYNIHHWSRNASRECPYSDLIDYAKNNNLIEKQFEDKDLWRRDERYHNYLNF